MIAALQTYHGGINTNNFLETMNRVYKRKWLNGRNDRRLDSLLKIYIADILPYYGRKYLMDNLLSLR